MNLLPPQSVDLIFADPPYNLQLSQDLFRPNETYVDSVDDHWDQFDSLAQYDRFTKDWLTAAKRVLKDEGAIWVIGAYHNIFRVGAIMMDLDYWILNDIVWIKSNPLPQLRGSRFCNAHETLIWAKKVRGGKAQFHYKDLKAGNDDLQMRSDWTIPLCTGAERQKTNGKRAHSTQKPEALLHRIIVSTSNPGDMVLDPFCGSGTTAAVAKKLGRRYITIDRETEYVEIASRRVDAVTPLPISDTIEIANIDAPPPRIPFVALVESGRIPAGASLRYAGSDRIATVNADGTVTCGDKRASIHKMGCIVGNTPTCNGWLHWLYRDRSGQERVINDFRLKRPSDNGQLVMWADELDG